jgi:CubicO group peptidase (beta-lactamase class C family)
LNFPGQARFLSSYNADSLLADLHHVHPDTLPGMRYQYNTNAVMLLQLLLERVYHDSYTHLITRWLQTHLRLYQTTPWLGPEQLRHTAQGYTKAGEPQPYVNLGGYYIGPTMNATFHDLLLFLQAEIAEGDPAIRLSHQRTWGTGNFGVGLNWMIDTEGGLRYLYHDGNTKVGFNSLCTVYPSQRLGIFVIGSDVQDQAKIGRLENVVHDGIVRSAQLSP